jgi:predicted outer membrane repeat protein
VTASTFSGNTATNTGGAGGGILSSSGTSNLGNTVAVTNSTFSGNSAGRGGGIAADDFNAVTVTNSTLSGNSGHFGGGIFIFFGGTVSLTNTLLAANTVTLGGANCGNTGGGTLTDGGHNLEFNPTNTCGFSAANHDVLADPHLGALGSNGGPTQTMALLTGSAAIAHGDATVCANTSGTAPVAGKDQRGYLRQVAVCSIGAYEAQPATPNPLPAPQPPGPPGGPPSVLPPRQPAGPPSGTIPNPLPAPRP